MQTSFRVRLGLSPLMNPAVALTNLLTRAAAAAWSHADWRLELGVLAGDNVSLDTGLSGLASVTAEFFAARGDSTAVLSRTVAAADFNGACTDAAWKAGTDQQVVMEFTNLETAFAFPGDPNTKVLWLVVYGLTTDAPAHRVPLWAGSFTVYELGAPAGATVIANGNLVPDPTWYSASGEHVVSGLVVGQLYEVVFGVNEVSLVCGGTTLTESGIFQATVGEATVVGNMLAQVTAVVRSAGTYTAAQVDARIASAAPVQFETIAIKDQGTGLYVTLAVRDGGIEVVS